MKRIVALLCASFAVASLYANVAVTNVTVQQRWPWNGLVDIDYEVLTDSPEEKVTIHANGRDLQNGRSVRMAALTGDGVGQRIGAGHYRMTWDSTADAPALNTTEFIVSLQAVSGNPLYAVIDLSEGCSLAYPAYPVTYLDKEPDEGWSDEYKTTKMVLRLIKSGVFVMGSPMDEIGRNIANETQHEVTLTQSFYIGVFEVTQSQWELVMGNNPVPTAHKGDMRPVEQVSYNNIRGTTLGAQWPTSDAVDMDSFIGRLRARTPLIFDLPTDAQWEYACRAGTITALNSGKAAADANMNEVGRSALNRKDGKGSGDNHTTVGVYLPNAWGLYDMHGNVWEWIRDWYVEDLGINNAIDPTGGISGTYRVVRGGSWVEGGASCRSALRSSVSHFGHASYPSNFNYALGLRVIAFPSMQ